MSFSFQPITGKRTFGTVGKTLESVGHIETIKLKNLRCTPERMCDYRANRFKGGWDSSKYTFYSRYRNKGSEFDSTQLYNGLYSVMDFNKKNPSIIKNNLTGESPTKMLPKGAACQPDYQRYTIDPDGKLFGNTACGIHNYMNYVKPSLQNKIIPTPKTKCDSQGTSVDDCEITPSIQDDMCVVDEVIDNCEEVRLECSDDCGDDYKRIFNIIVIAFPNLPLKQIYTYCDSIVLKFMCLEDIVTIDIIEKYDANCNDEKPETTTCGVVVVEENPCDIVVVEEPSCDAVIVEENPCDIVVVEENPCDIVVVEDPPCDIVVVEDPPCDVVVEEAPCDVVVEEAVSSYDKLYDFLHNTYPLLSHKQILKLCNTEVRRGTVPFDLYSKRK